MQCSSCGAPASADARFCSTCGHDLRLRADERRVVTVLFADIVGFTGLSETLDPEQVKLLVDRCFAALADDITSFGGRVDKVVGDAIIALFGAPVAHDDDAERAVRAALKMLETVSGLDPGCDPRIELRVGINTGEVIVGGIAAGDDYTAMGDVVNTAARLEAVAEPGTVLVGRSTHEATSDVICFGPERLVVLRGREGPVTVWQAIEPVGRPGERRTGPMTPLLGREPELVLMRRGIAAAFRRERAHLLAIHGESGVGKSRLAAEVVERARLEHDATVLTGRCLPYGEANVWWPVAEALRGAIGIDVDTPEQAGRAAITAAVARAHEEPPDSPDVEQTTEGLLNLLGYAGRLDGLDPARAADEASRAVRSFLARLSERRPLVIWLADLHWADTVVLQLIDDTLGLLGRRRVVLIVTARPELADRWRPHAAHFNIVSMVLDPLDEAAAERLLLDLLGPDVDAVERRELIVRAGGNPLFLEELARMVSEGAGASELPPNVRSVISARLDGLEDEALAVLEDAAVLGLRGSVVALREMGLAIRSADDIDAPLAHLVVDDFLLIDGDRWSFRSSLVRDVAYARLTKSDRAWRHAGIASSLESRGLPFPEQIAFHYRRAAALDRELGGGSGLPPALVDAAIDWTSRVVRAAGDQSSERIQRLYSEALDLLDHDDPRRAPLLLGRARSDLSQLRLIPAKADLAEAGRLAMTLADPGVEVTVALVASEVAQWEGDLSRSLDDAERALVVVADLDDPVLTGEALRRRGMVQLLLSREDEAERSISSAYDAYSLAGDVSGMAWARQNLAWISYGRGRMGEAEQRLQAALETFEELGDHAGMAWSRGLLAYVRIYEGRFGEAEELARHTLIDSRERGDSWGQGMMLIALGNVALWTGRVDDAVRRGEEARSLFEESADPVGSTQTVSLLGRALVRSGRVSEGLQLFHEAAARTEDWERALDFFASAAVAAAATAGDVEAAARYRVTLEGLDFTVIGQADLAVGCSLSALQSGDPERAASLISVIPAPPSDQGSTWGWATAALVAVARGDDPSAFVSAVENEPRATYTDRVLAGLAEACHAVRTHDETGARRALERAGEAIPDGGDRVHPAIVAIATAGCLAELDTVDAPDAATLAWQMLESLGIDGAGWNRAFATVLGRAPVADQA
ncbi:MAG: adenylate/guanylate cyclase domain-containing protein [Acidimicrobiales bacterium]